MRTLSESEYTEYSRAWLKTASAEAISAAYDEGLLTEVLRKDPVAPYSDVEAPVQYTRAELRGMSPTEAAAAFDSGQASNALRGVAEPESSEDSE